MRINVNVLLGLLLCVLLVVIGGTMYRMSDEEDTWRPDDIYTHVGGSSYTSSSVPSHSSDGVVVAMRGVSRPSRRYAAAPAFSYAQGYSAPMASTQYPIGGTPSNSVASPIYTISSAMTKSFGSGYGAGAAASAQFARNAQESTRTMQTVPTMPSLTDFSTSSNPLFAMNAQHSTSSATPVYTPMGMQGRRRIGIEDNYLGWLDHKWTGGWEGITEQQLRDLYVEMTGDTDFSNEQAWIAFWEWFLGKQGDDFAWKLVPLSDATWFVLLLCMMYAVVVYRKAKASKASAK